VEGTTQPVRAASCIHDEARTNGPVVGQHAGVVFKDVRDVNRTAYVGTEVARALEEQLVEIGAPHLEPLPHAIVIFTERLEHRSSNVVKDTLAIIDLIDPPTKLDLYAKCFEHPNVAIRLEALKVIAKATGDRAVKHLERAAQDSALHHASHP
jgi:hypothetical protein